MTVPRKQNLTYEALIARCVVHTYSHGIYSREMLIDEAKNIGHSAFGIDEEVMDSVFNTGSATLHPLSERVLLAYRSHEGLESPELVVFRFLRQCRHRYVRKPRTCTRS